jgi:SAM-dependent methyltransferase
MTIRLKPEARTALRHVGGPTVRRGDAALAEALERAFDVGEAEAEAARAHVHGFHSYPARLHPVTAARLLSTLGKPGIRVLDPFCGSGTVLVEARALGAATVGTDVNPLAIRLARLKLRGVPAPERGAIESAARFVAEHASRRRAAHLPPTSAPDPDDERLFDPHVLRELDSLRDGIDRVDPPALRLDLELVFSAILTKMSRKEGDSGNYLRARRLAPGFPTRFFVQKAEELGQRLAEYQRRLPTPPPPFDVHADDARTLGTVKASSIDLVVTSPPYAATYDYVGHHDVRLRWLRIGADRFSQLELGARRDYANERHPAAAEARWRGELGQTLAAIARVLTPDGRCAMVLADSGVLGRALRADDIVESLAPSAGLVVEAMASQPRPHFHGPTARAFAERPRHEHLILLGKSSAAREGVDATDESRGGAPT